MFFFVKTHTTSLLDFDPFVDGSEIQAGFFDGLFDDLCPVAAVDFDLGGVVVDKALEVGSDVVSLEVGDHPAAALQKGHVDGAG